MRLNIFRINLHLTSKEILVKSKLVSGHWGVSTLCVPPPRTSLPVEDMNLAVGCGNNAVDVALENKFITKGAAEDAVGVTQEAIQF